MEESFFDNCINLKEFYSSNNLRESNGRLNALVSIKTAKHHLKNKLIPVTISLEEYDSLGKVRLMTNDLDVMLYPTEFEAKWQTMEFIDEEYLLIKGEHKKNSQIGEYIVKVIPMPI